MKFNKWTTALAAAGVVSLGAVAQAEEASNPVLSAVSSTTLSGYVDTSAIWQFGKQANAGGVNRLPGRSYDGPDKQDGFNLNVVKLSLEKPLTDQNWSAGYKVDLLFGPDANTYATTSTLGGTSSDFAVKQAYVALRAPVGNGLDFKMGVFDTVIGYEVFESGNNPNYSRSYGYYIEPQSHTGLLASYQVSEWLSVAGGIANTVDSTINGRSHVGDPTTVTDRESSESVKSYMGSVALTAPESFGALQGATLYGGIVEGQPTGGSWSDIQNYYAGVTIPTPLTGLSVGAAYDYKGISSSGNHPSSYANALAGYLVYKANDKLTLASRTEWASFAGNYFTLEQCLASDAAINPAAARGLHEVLAETITLDYKLSEPVITRLEFRWDHDLNGRNSFGVDDVNAMSLALNVIYKF